MYICMISGVVLLSAPVPSTFSALGVLNLPGFGFRVLGFRTFGGLEFRAVEGSHHH